MNIRNTAISAKLPKNRSRSKLNVGKKKRIRKYPINAKIAISVAATFIFIFYSLLPFLHSENLHAYFVHDNL